MSGTFDSLCGTHRPSLEALMWNLDVESWETWTFVWNLATFKSGTFMSNHEELKPLCGTWEPLRVEPLCGTLGNLYVEPRGTGTFMWNLDIFNSGTFMRNLGEPGSWFRVAAPNHPEALLEEPQVFQAAGELTHSLSTPPSPPNRHLSNSTAQLRSKIFPVSRKWLSVGFKVTKYLRMPRQLTLSKNLASNTILCPWFHDRKLNRSIDYDLMCV